MQQTKIPQQHIVGVKLTLLRRTSRIWCSLGEFEKVLNYMARYVREIR